MVFTAEQIASFLGGTVEGDELKGVCRTKKFSFDVNGTRVS